MTPDESTDSVRVAAVLATVMTEADCASPEYPFSDLSRARAILASDWLADVVAQAKAEALLPIRRFAEAGAISAKALGQKDRDFLDLLILCDRAEATS